MTAFAAKEGEAGDAAPSRVMLHVQLSFRVWHLHLLLWSGNCLEAGFRGHEDFVHTPCTRSREILLRQSLDLPLCRHLFT